MLSLVNDVHLWKKWWSMRFLIVSAFLNAVTVAYATLPDDWMPYPYMGEGNASLRRVADCRCSRRSSGSFAAGSS